MNRQWKMKALVFLIGLTLVCFGRIEVQSDPALRTLQALSIAAIERGERPPVGQYVRIDDAYLLGSYVIEPTPAGRPRGDVHVHAAMGSQSMRTQVRATVGSAAPALWVRLEDRHADPEAAAAAMRRRVLEDRPLPVRGLVRGDLEESVSKKMQEEGWVLAEQPLSLRAGTAPAALGAGGILTLVGAAIWLLVALWLAADRSAARWLMSLARVSPRAEVFQGRSGRVLWTLVGGPVFLAAVGTAIGLWIDSQEFNALAWFFTAAGLLLFVWGLWRSRLAVLLHPDALEILRGGKPPVRVLLAHISALEVDERKVKKLAVVRYALHTDDGGRPIELGNSLFKGGLDQAEALGARLRQLLFEPLALACAERLRQGQKVEFGPLSVSSQGLSKARQGDAAEVLPWAQVAGVSFKKGEMRVTRKGKWLVWGRFPVRRLLNLDVLLDVLRDKGLTSV